MVMLNEHNKIYGSLGIQESLKTITKIEKGTGRVVLTEGIKAPFEKFELSGNSKQGCTINISSEELEQGTLNTTNGANYPSNYRVRTKDFISVEKGLYKITCEGAKQGNVIEYEENGTWKKTWFDANAPFPWSMNFTENCKVRIALSNGTEGQILIKPSDVKSITLQTEATPETPQEIVSAGKYDEVSGKYVIDVSVTGKNLFDISKYPFSHANETIIISPNEGQVPVKNGINITEDIKFEENTQYVISYDSYNVTQAYENWTTIFTFYYTDGTYRDLYVNHFYGNLKKYFNSDPGKTIRNVAVRNPWKVGIEISKVQIEKSTKPTEYEPYHEPQTLQLQLDRPLTKWDRIEKRDGVYGIVYKHRTVDDLATLVKDNTVIYGSSGNRYFSIDFKDVNFNYDYSKAYSEVGLYKKDINVLYVPRLQVNSATIGVSDTDTIETAKEHLHYKVIYETDSEEFIPFPQETQLALNSLHTNDGTTIITVDSGEVETGIEVHYKSYGNNVRGV